MLDKQLEFVLKGGLTKRYHTNGTIREQNVAEHSFFVAWLLELMYGALGRNLAFAAVFHDIAEGAVGDVASPVKRSICQLKGLLDTAEANALRAVELTAPRFSEEEYRRLKMADNMEGLLYCVEEIRRGNSDAIEIYNNFLSYVLSLDPMHAELDVLIAIQGRLKCHTLIAAK